MKPYYDEDGITIYHARWEDVLPDLPEESVDLVVTSPPYNMGLVPGGGGRGMYRPGASRKAGRFREGYGEYSDAMPQDEYDAWQRRALAECWRVVRRAIFYNHRCRVEHGRLRMPLSMDFGPDLLLRQIITWDRRTGIDVNLRHYCTAQEWILLFAKPVFTLVSHAASGTSDVWRFGMDHSGVDHPAPFPVSLPTRAITTSGALSVVDPFMGSGTTLRAAKDVGIPAVGIEPCEAYCEIAVKRLAQGSLFGAAS